MTKEEIDLAFDTFRHGIYRHYKGGLYRSLSLVAHHDTREPWVLYVSLKQGSINIRPLWGPDGWQTAVEVNEGHRGDAVVQRFSLVDVSLDGLDGTDPGKSAVQP